MKKFHAILSASLFLLICIIILLKTYLIGGKHLFPYFAFVILIVEILISLLLLRNNRKGVLQSGLIYAMGYIMIVFCLFKIFHWPNHDHEIITVPKGYTPYTWQIETPNVENFKTAELSKILEKAQDITHLRSVLIVKDEKLILEKYFHGSSKNDAFNIFLMSQTFVSSLIGIAIEENYIENVNQKAIDFFPKYKSNASTSDKADLTIEDLLTNSAGLSGDQNERSFQSLNWTKSTLERPRRKKTGDFKLQQQTAHLLSGIITEASGMNTLAFTEKYLCEPIGIKIIEWFKSPEGIYRGSNAIYITPRDLARYGNLYLSGGKIGDQQIIPEEWIERSKSVKVKKEFVLNDNFKITGIGYSWLSGKIHGHNVFLSTDLGGQFIINIPKENITVVTTTNKPFDYQTMESLVSDLISTIR